MTQIIEESVARGGSARRYSQEDLAKYHRTFAEDGYCIFRGVVPKDVLSRHGKSIVQEFERAKGSGSLFAGGGLISGHLNYFPGEEARGVYEALEEHGIVDFVRAIFPTKVGIRRAGGNFNMPKSVAQHYHVDGNFTEDFMVVNVAVVDTDLTNGAIDVLPGTHKKFYKYWRFALERTY